MLKNIISRLSMKYSKPAFSLIEKKSNKLIWINEYVDCYGKKWLAQGIFKLRHELNEEKH